MANEVEIIVSLNDRASRQMNTTSQNVKRAATGLGIAVLAELGRATKGYEDHQRVVRDTEQTIRSTGGAAKVTAKDVEGLANAIEKKTSKDGDAIQSGANMLLTFTNIRNEVGKGNDIFNQTTSVLTDVTAKMNGGRVTQEGMAKSAIQLGKAMNDPIKGVTALTRIGVTFTDEQKRQIKIMTESGNILGAQKIILAELNKEFGGAAAASATSGEKFAVAMHQMEDSLGKALLPAMEKGAKVAGSLASGITTVNDATGGTASILLAAGGAALILAPRVKSLIDVYRGLTAAQLTAARAAGIWAAGLTLAASANDIEKKSSSLAARIHANYVAPIYEKLGIVTQDYVDKKKAEINAANRVAEASKGQALSTAHLKQITGEALTTEESAALTKDELKKKTDKLTAALKTLKEGYKDQVQAVRDAIIGYDGLISKSKVTAAQVVKDIHNQVRNFKTYSSDVQRLIKAGVDPAAIQELSKKGPEYIHALATGSNRQLQTYKQYWKDRQHEIKTSFEASMQKQFENLQKKIKAMQREINRLKGKTVDVGASAHITLEQRTKQALNALGIKGYGVKFMAAGGITRVGDVAVVGEKGPELVQFNRPARVHSNADSKQMLARGMADGGIIGGFRDPAVAGIERLGQLVVNGIASAVGSSLSTAVKNAISGMVSGISVPSSQNRSIVHQVFANMFGWTGGQLSAADQLIMHESGFRNTAQNPTSTAYGMFQFLNSTWGSVGGYKTSDPRLQAIFGGKYIKSRYGSPAGAWNFWQGHHWYHGGGSINEDILGIGASGRTYGFQAGETVSPKGGGGVVLEIHPGGSAIDQMFIAWLRKAVRTGQLSF